MEKEDLETESGEKKVSLHKNGKQTVWAQVHTSQVLCIFIYTLKKLSACIYSVVLFSSKEHQHYSRPKMVCMHLYFVPDLYREHQHYSRPKIVCMYLYFILISTENISIIADLKLSACIYILS